MHAIPENGWHFCDDGEQRIDTILYVVVGERK